MIWLKINNPENTFTIYDKCGEPLFYVEKPFSSIKIDEDFIEITTNDLKKISIPQHMCVMEDIY